MTALCPQMIIFLPILAPLGGDVCTVCWADASQKTCHILFSHVWPSLRQLHRSEYKPRVKRGTAIIDESMEKWSMHLSGDGGLLLYVVEGPSASKVTQGFKYQQFNRRRHLVIQFCTTPMTKTCLVSYPLQDWNKVFETSPKTLFTWKSPPTWDNYLHTSPTTGTILVSWTAIPNPQNLCIHKHILAPGIFLKIQRFVTNRKGLTDAVY